MLKKICLAATAIIMILSLAFVWQTGRDLLSPADLRFVITAWPASRLVYAVKAKGLFKKYGVEVSIIDANANYEIAMDMLRRHAVDGGTFVLAEPLRLTAEGVPVKVVSNIDYSSGADGIVAVADIKSLSDLRGRRVAVPERGVSNLLLREAMRRASLAESDIVLQPQSPLLSADYRPSP